MTINQQSAGSLRSLCALMAVCAFSVFAAGCDMDEGYLDHRPPAGKGTLIIDNHTGDDVGVYLDGHRLGLASEYDNRIDDLDPGAYRLVLTEDHDGTRSYGMDIDILDGRLTIVDVSTTTGSTSSYQVSVRFEN